MSQRHIRWEELDSWMTEEKVQMLEAWELGFRESSEASMLHSICPVRQCRRKHHCQGPMASKPADCWWAEDRSLPFMPECLWSFPGRRLDHVLNGLARHADLHREGRQGRLPGTTLLADRIRQARAKREAAERAREASPFTERLARYRRELEAAQQSLRAERR